MTKKIIPLTLFGVVCLGILPNNNAHAAFLFKNNSDTDVSAEVTLDLKQPDESNRIPSQQHGIIEFPAAKVKGVYWNKGPRRIVTCDAQDLTTRSIKTFTLSGREGGSLKCE